MTKRILTAFFLASLASWPAAAHRTATETDMIYVDEELLPQSVQEEDALWEELGLRPGFSAPVDLLVEMHPAYTGLRRGLLRYRQSWGDLPQVEVPRGPTLRLGDKGERVKILRHRLGLQEGDRFDQELAAKLLAFQKSHGVPETEAADAATVAALNLGSEHFERIIVVNMERARTLPTGELARRYLLVDSAAARLFFYENGRVVDSMKVAVGKDVDPTPMMAGLLRQAEVNPFWNVPPDMARTLIARNVLEQGFGYLEARGYDVLSDWSDDAVVIDPAEVDWEAVASGDRPLRVRQRPGPANSMGDIKFLMPNELGIYLHDTPNAAVFEAEGRFVSAGCIRLEDADRLAVWLFGAFPKVGRNDEPTFIDIENPVPLYITYFTAAPGSDGSVVFRPDTYGRDPAMLARMFGEEASDETASRL